MTGLGERKSAPHQLRGFRLLVIGLAVTLLAAMLPPSAVWQGEIAAQEVTPLAGDVIVVLNVSGVDPEVFASGMGVEPAFVYRDALLGFAATLTPEAARRLAQSSVVQGIYPNTPVYAAAQLLPAGINRVNADQNPIANINGTDEGLNVDVAVIDSGVNSLADLNVVGGVNCYDPPNPSFSDGLGHGTHVAGTIAARDNTIGVVGVAPGARIYSVRVLSSSGTGFVSQLICGLDWVAANAGVIDVANMSLTAFASSTTACGSPGADPLRTAVCSVVNANVPVTVAAGNHGGPISANAMANFPEVITVSGFTDFDGQPGGLAATPVFCGGQDDTFYASSGTGPAVDIMAPATCVVSLSTSGGLSTRTGTSMAVAHVAGALALYKSTNPGASAQGARNWLLSSGSVSQAAAGMTGDPDGIAEPVLMLGSDGTPTSTATATRTSTPTRTPTSTNTPTNTPTPTPTNTPTNTPPPTNTSTPSNTPLPPTNTPTRTPTSTPTNTSLPTNTPTPSNTPLPPTNTPTRTPTNTPTNTPPPTNTSTPSNTPTPSRTATNTPLPTSTHTPTNTPVATNTHTPTNTAVPTNTRTNTPTRTSTPLPTSTSTRTPTPPPGGLVPNDLVRTTANLNMRSAPGITSSIVDVIPNGTQAVVTSFGVVNGAYTWFRINAPGFGSGWVAGAFLTKIGVVTPTTVPPTATATRTPTVTRTPTTGPPATSTSTRTPSPTVPAGGFAPNDLVETTANLNMRTGAGTGNPSVAILPNGTEATVLSFGVQSGIYTWYQINAPGYGTGWVAGAFLTKVGTATSPPQPTATSTTVSGAWPAGSSVETDFAVNMRTGPSTSNSIVVTLPGGITCSVIAGPTVNEYTWYQLNCPGYGTGWVAAEFLTLMASGASAASSDDDPAPEPAEIAEIESTATDAAAVATEPPVEIVPTEPQPVIEEPTSAPPAEPQPEVQEPEPYTVARIQRTESTSHGSVLVDEDPLTVWSTDGAAVLPLASFALDLNEVLDVGNVRWLPGEIGISGRLLIHISVDGENWTEIDLEAVVSNGQWSEIGVYTPARFVRFAFINEDGSAVIGGIAEAEVWP